MVFLDIETTTFFQDEHIKALPRDQQIAAMEFGIAVTTQSTRPKGRRKAPFGLLRDAFILDAHATRPTQRNQTRLNGTEHSGVTRRSRKIVGVSLRSG